MLITGADATSVSVLACLTVDLARRPRPVDNPVRISVIDRSDRSLIRLRQLPHTLGYATVDALDAVADIIARIDTRTTSTVDEPGLDVLVVNELGRLLHVLALAGRHALVDRLASVIGRHDGARLMVAATCARPDELPDAVRRAFRTSLFCPDGHPATLATPDGERSIDLRDWSTERVTTEVAALVGHAAA